MKKILALALVALALASTTYAQAPTPNEFAVITSPAKPGIGEYPVTLRPDFEVRGSAWGTTPGRVRAIYLYAVNVNVPSSPTFLGSSFVGSQTQYFGATGWWIPVNGTLSAGDYQLVALLYNVATPIPQFLMSTSTGTVHVNGCTARMNTAYPVDSNAGKVYNIYTNQCVTPIFYPPWWS